VAHARVLVVDDDAGIRDLIKFRLESAGHEVLTASNGEEGLATALREHPGLVLLDVAMPKMDGIEVCKRLRADADMQLVPIVLITARSEESDVEVGFAAGADDYVTKPFSPRQLMERLEAILERASTID
jgi:two-component system, OmpR family, phosphate regulon response regulator PhoB